LKKKYFFFKDLLIIYLCITSAITFIFTVIINIFYRTVFSEPLDFMDYCSRSQKSLTLLSSEKNKNVCLMKDISSHTENVKIQNSKFFQESKLNSYEYKACRKLALQVSILATVK